MKAFKIAGYIAFFFLSLAVGLYMTLPWDALRDPIVEGIQRSLGASAKVSIGSVQPNWVTGLTLRNVKFEAAGQDQPLEIDRLDVRMHVFKVIRGLAGVTVSAPIGKGSIKVSFSSDADGYDVLADAKDVEIALVPGLKELTGLPLSGSLSLESSVRWSVKDPTKTQGHVKLNAVNLEVLQGAKIQGLPLPPLSIGTADLTIPIENGKAHFEKQRITGDTAEVIVDGDITLNGRAIEKSALALTTRLKPADALLKKEPLVGVLLNNVSKAKGADGFYAFSVTGTLRSPYTARAKN